MDRAKTIDMEDSKYYIPEIEEFHVGFSYEVKGYRPVKTKMGTVNNRIFGKVSYQDTKPLWQIQQDIKDGDIRVKYLDQEDIESLGFTVATKQSAFIKEDYTLWSGINNIILIEYKKESCVFKGIIKNKSELKKLLKQLSIK